MIFKAIENAINFYLRLDSDGAKRQLHSLQGHCIKIVLTDFPVSFFLLFQEGGVRVLNSYSKMPEAIIESKSTALLASQFIQNPVESIRVQGNVELGYEVYGLFNSIEIDWEEHLSRYVGDVIANPIGNLARGIVSSFKTARKSLNENLVEYLQEEIGLLPSRQEVEDFCQSVELCRQQLERLEAYLT